MPLAKIIHSYDRSGGVVERQFRGGTQDRQGDGCQGVWSARGNMPTIHLMGGTIMGTAAGNSVTNSYGQTTKCRTSTSPGPEFCDRRRVNPTYTIFALSLRGAEQLASNWSTVAG